MASNIFDIALVLFVICSCIIGIYYSVKLRITSNAMAMKTKEEEDQDILRIFEEMEKKVIETNPDYVAITEGYKTNQLTLENYQEYIFNSFNQTTVSTSNHVTV